MRIVTLVFAFLCLFIITSFGQTQYWQPAGSSIYYYDGNVGIGTKTPVNKLDVVSGTAGTMARNAYEMASFEQNGDAKLGIYTSSNSFSAGGAEIPPGMISLVGLIALTITKSYPN